MKQQPLKKRSFLDDIKNVKKNYKIVKSSPYASLKFGYFSQKMMVGLLTIYFIYKLSSIIINYNVGSSLWTLVGRIAILLVLALIIVKTWQTLGPIKQRLKDYENNPKNINYSPVNVKVEIDEILSKFDDKGNKIKGGKK